MLDQQKIALTEARVLPSRNAHVEEHMHLLGMILTQIIRDWLKRHPDSMSSSAADGQGRRRARGVTNTVDG